jgi:hypothetical protein
MYRWQSLRVHLHGRFHGISSGEPDHVCLRRAQYGLQRQMRRSRRVSFQPSDPQEALGRYWLLHGEGTRLGGLRRVWKGNTGLGVHQHRTRSGEL